MCSRYSRVSVIRKLQKRFRLENVDFDLSPDYNIAPTDPAYVVIQEGDKRFLKRMMFGLIPYWAKDPKIAVQCLNARAETIGEKPAFRDAFQKRRCLVITDGFFEWKKDGKNRYPYRVVMKNGGPYALAGIWDRWKRPDGRDFETFAIVTTEPDELIAPIHNRMPVILKEEGENLWLAPYVTEAKTIQPLLKPFPSEMIDLIAVSTAVNSSNNKSEECISPAV